MPHVRDNSFGVAVYITLDRVMIAKLKTGAASILFWAGVCLVYGFVYETSYFATLKVRVCRLRSWS